MGSSVLEHAIKVRKPYAITKQREKWSEEEHNKFLEALKLYGRTWRQIEEHIGSKTAVQIRSHAQKFFSKAVRESKTIEIPPPRPKKRPMRPYPRKLGNLPSIPVMEKFPVSEQDNPSPTSVLSSTSDQMNSCTSPLSSVAGSDPVRNLPCEQEHGCQSCHSAIISVDDEDESLPGHTSNMEQDSGTDDRIPSIVASSMEAQAASLRLFGQTVVIADPQKPSSFNNEDAGPATTIDAQKPSSFNAEDYEPAITIDAAPQLPALVREQSITDRVLTFLMGSQGNPWASSTAPMFYLLPSHGNLAYSTHAAVAPMPPWFWAFSGENQNSVRECLDDGSVQKESSPVDSNSVELSIKDTGTRVFSDRGELPVKLRQSETSAFRSLKATPKKDTTGFVPYIRCLAEKA